jgi:transaldolase
MASIWLDCDNQELLKNRLASLVQENRLTGVMINSSLYKTSMSEDEFIKDIQNACEVLMNKYDDGEDGFICCSIDMSLAKDTKKIVTSAKEIFQKVEKDNFMVAIPATKEGIEALSKLSTKVMNLCATHIFSPNQASMSAKALTNLERNCEGVLRVEVAAFDKLLNVELATNNLSKDRVGFFNAIKIYNQVSQTKLPNVNLKVCFSDLAVYQNWLDKGYYVEQLNLHNAILNLPIDVIDYYEDEKMPEAFEFQTKHIDAFLSYLSYANISLQSTYEILLNNALKEPF